MEVLPKLFEFNQFYNIYAYGSADESVVFGSVLCGTSEVQTLSYPLLFINTVYSFLKSSAQAFSFWAE